MITYLQGDATAPKTEGIRIITHICNNSGGWGRGFVLALSQRWPEPEKAYRGWVQKESFQLGNIQLVRVLPDTWVCNMIAQHGYATINGIPPVRYDALAQCLQKLAIEAQRLEASIHMPRIGIGLGGGTWDRIEPILNDTLQAMPVYVYVI